jgi:hypothetical protein
MAVARPSPEFAAALTEALSRLDEVKDIDDITLDIEMEDEDIYFGAISVDGVVFDGPEVKGTLDELAWGEFEETGEGLFMLEDFELTGIGDKGVPVDIRLGAVNATGLNTGHVRRQSGAPSL